MKISRDRYRTDAREIVPYHGGLGIFQRTRIELSTLWLQQEPSCSYHYPIHNIVDRKSNMILSGFRFMKK
jgi:hypothetical protein